MEMGKLKVELVAGEVMVSYDVGSAEQPQMVKLQIPAAALIGPMLDAAKAKVESGEIDPIKGTDMDKEVILKALVAVKAALA